MQQNLNLFIQNISDLNETQRASYYRFLYKGFSEEILNFQNPFFIYKKNTKFKKSTFNLIYLHLNNIKLVGPKQSINLCFQQNLSYTIRIYIKSEFSYSVKTDFPNFKLYDFKTLLLKEFFKKKIFNKLKLNKIFF